MRKKVLIITVSLLLLVLFLTPPACAEGKKTPNELLDVFGKLKSGAWVHLYKPNQFDCSNMSALLDFTLDCLGFDSRIVEGICYRVENGKLVFTGGHAMVLVSLESKDLILPDVWWVEATTLNAWRWQDSPFVYGQGYFLPIRVYRTAMEAYAAKPWEYTWTLNDVKLVFDTIPQQR